MGVAHQLYNNNINQTLISKFWGRRCLSNYVDGY